MDKTDLSLSSNRQAELEGRHSQARAWERDIVTKSSAFRKLHEGYLATLFAVQVPVIFSDKMLLTSDYPYALIVD